MDFRIFLMIIYKIYFFINTEYTNIITKVISIYCQQSVVLILWIFSLAIICACIFGMKPLMSEHHKQNFFEDTMFLTFSKTGWSASVIWIIIACNFGYGGKKLYI